MPNDSATTGVPGSGDPGDSVRLRAAARGDVHAFTEIVAARLGSTYRLACTILGNPSDAADATQDAFVAAWRELPRLRNPAEFASWLDRIVVDQCRMLARQRVAAGGLPGDDALARLVSASTSLALDADALLDLLDDRFEQLDPDDRAILALRHLQERPVADIGIALHLPVGTVKWRLHDARRALAVVLESV